MKKLVLGAAISAALMGGNAQAAISVDGSGLPIINPTNTNILYLSGASAAVNFIEKLITDPTVPAADKICDTTQKIWKYKDSVTGSDQNAYLCVAATTNPGVPTNKPNILIYKRSAGGSAFGVSPIIAEANGDAAAAAIGFLKISSSCTIATPSSTFETISCPYNKDDLTTQTLHIPDFGISDVDPAQFTGDNAPAGFANVTSADVAKLNVKSASAVAFGVPVTLNLFKVLQAAQKTTGEVPSSCALGDATEACLPTLNSAQIASIHTGSWADWEQLKVGTTGQGLFTWASDAANGVTAYLPDASYVHLCRRENGSGTQAQSNVIFLADPCTAAATATTPQADLTADFAEGDGFAMVHENNTSGSVSNCLDELQDGTDAVNGFSNVWGKRWAVGIQSLEKKSSKFEFVKVDGVAPTLANIVKGKYKDWAENTFQYGISHVFSSNSTENTALKKLTDAVIKSAGAPEVMAALNSGFTHTFGNGSFLAVPSNYTPEANGAYNSARPVSPYSHATSSSSVNACRVPTIYNNGDAKL